MTIDAKFLQNLQRLTAEGPSRDDPYFHIWRQDAIAHLSGIDHQSGLGFAEQFQSVSYAPTSNSDVDVNPSDFASEYDLQQKYAEVAHQKGLYAAQGVLHAALRWARDYAQAGPITPTMIIPKEIKTLPSRFLSAPYQIDEVIITYIEEALNCLNIGAYLAATVMIGGASEKAMLLLIDCFEEHIISDNAKMQFANKTKGRDIRPKFDIFKQSYQSCQNKPPKMVQHIHNFTVSIERVFEYCRVARNEVGHPHTIPDINKETVLLPLRNFYDYVIDIYDMMAHFEQYGVEL